MFTDEAPTISHSVHHHLLHQFDQALSQDNFAQALLVTDLCIDGVMTTTTDFSHTWLPTSQSPCLDPNNKVLSWERCVKRKYNDESGKVLQEYTMAKTEGGNCSFSCDAMWGTMPSITHCYKTSINSTTTSSVVSLQDKQRGKGCNLLSGVSNVGVFPHNQHLIVENKLAYTDHPLQPPYIQNDKKDAVSKKRIHVAMNVETLPGACDKATENEVLRLKEALQFEKGALRKLYRDLEEERCASRTAANEAMAMIRRLQEEKAAALVESCQYKHASEEREAYNQESITLLKEALSFKEHEVLSLQDHIENYRDTLTKMKSGQGLIQTIESNHLEGDKENAQLLLLEGKETTSCLLEESKCLKRNLDGACDAGDRASGNSMYWHYYPREESFLERQIYEDIEIENMGFDNPQCENNRSDTGIEEDFEDVSMSILARVARLEERFACFGENQALDPECFDLVPQNMPGDISFLACGTRDPASMPLDNTELNCSKSAKLKVGFVADNCEDLEDLECPDFERPTTNSEYGKKEHDLSAPIEDMGLKLNDMKSREYSKCLPKATDDQEHSFSEIEDAASDGGCDVYEVQCRLDGSAMPYLDHINGSYESGFGGRDFLLINAMQVVENEMFNGATPVPGTHLPSYDDLAGSDSLMNDKLAAEISSAVGESVKSSVVAKDLRHLKVRLQALEGERVFMKEAIEALSKENMELKLLQEIANRLQELRGSGRRDQLPFLSFFKGILSFAGIHSLASTEKRSFFYGCQGSLQISSHKQEHGGLLHLLNNSRQEEKNVCLTREHKVKLGNT